MGRAHRGLPAEIGEHTSKRLVQARRGRARPAVGDEPPAIGILLPRNVGGDGVREATDHTERAGNDDGTVFRYSTSLLG